MPKAKIHFREMVQDSQDYGSNDEHMVSRVFFTLEINGRIYEGLHADVKQAVGSSFENGPLEVSPPTGYDGPLDWGKFRDAAEGYYRSLVGSQGSGIHIEGSKDIRMRNNRFIQPISVEFDFDAK